MQKVIQNHVNELRDLTNRTPDLGLHRGIHLLLIDGQVNELVQDLRDLQLLRVVVGLAELDEVLQPGRHVLQAQVLQLDGAALEALYTLLQEL